MYLFAHFSRFCAGIGGLMSKNIAILASGNGTNAENIIRYFQNSESVNIGLVLANRETAFGFGTCTQSECSVCLYG